MSRSRDRIDHAASLLLGRLAKGGLLLETLRSLSFVPADSGAECRSGYDKPPLQPEEINRLGQLLRERIEPANFDAVQALTGVPAELIVPKLVEQLRHVAMFATSDGGSIVENVQAVERLVRQGAVDMFAAA